MDEVESAGMLSGPVRPPDAPRPRMVESEQTKKQPALKERSGRAESDPPSSSEAVGHKKRDGTTMGRCREIL